ncbi:MAG: DedA family protein [Gemmatimonadetes bacterium]|nr:DedA family protein [Gemmatimonadota bacterium]MBI3566841.1 DedA family protein [Gemmatimonadota bacterium]
MADFLNAVSATLVSIPLWQLYLLLGAMAFIEGIFPPVPADVVVALGSFLAARRGANYYVTASSIVIGSVAGAMVVYAIARRYGAEWLHAKLKKAGVDNLEQRLEVMYSRYGLTALFVSRFLPGLRAVTPPMSGATRVPPVRTALVFLAASAIWYGAIAWIAFRVGDDWEGMQRAVRHFARQVGIVAFFAAGLLAAFVIVIVRRRAAARLAKVIDEATSGEGTPED